MRKFILTFMYLCLASWSFADDYTYNYLVFTDSQGKETALAVDGLEIKFSGGQLVATNADGTKTLSLADLAKMQFAETAETVTGIDEIGRSPSAVTVYTLSGVEMGVYDDLETAQRHLAQGVYVARQEGSTTKFCVK